MTATTQKRKKKTEVRTPALSKRGKGGLVLLTSAISGFVLGLAAPGIEVWWLAWIGLTPLLLLAVSSNRPRQAFLRGLLFGTCYNLVYQNWYLGLSPLDWLGFNAWQGWLLAGAAWLIISVQQGLIIGIFAAIAKALPMTGTFLPEREKSKWTWPALVTLPLLWVLIVNKLGNAHYFLGVPFSMLEYTQYKQISLIQIASIIGGIGIGAIIVMTNAVIASLIASFYGQKSVAALAAPSRTIAIHQCLAMGLILTGMLAFGFYQSSNLNAPSDIPLSVIQGNVNIDMEKDKRRYSLADLLARQLSLVGKATGEICVWTESSLPVYLSRESLVARNMAQLAQRRGFDMIVGSMDADASGRHYNAAYGISSRGKMLPTVYHKRYLVPFGEYTPEAVRYMPEWVHRLTNTPAGSGFTSGNAPVVLNLTKAKVGPLICFETISPEEVAATVREGAELLVNLSDLAWFHDSMIGEQMIATSVMRAIENRRYFVFAANTGPSAIVDPRGKVVKKASLGQAEVLTGNVGLMKEFTPFSRWMLF